MVYIPTDWVKMSTKLKAYIKYGTITTKQSRKITSRKILDSDDETNQKIISKSRPKKKVKSNSDTI